MSQINQLYPNDFDANVDLADGSKVKAEIVQLVSESNAQDTRLTAIESGTLTISGAKTFSGTLKSDTLDERTAASGVTVDGLLIKDGGATFLKNPSGVLTSKITPPYYASAATITIPTGNMAVTSDGFTITLAADRTISLATSGAGGLASGSEASNTWYYPWLIADSTGVNTPHAVFHTSYTSSPTIPSGYNRAAWLSSMAVRNDSSSNIIPFNVTGWPYAPYVQYQVLFARTNATTVGPTSVLKTTSGSTPTTYTNLDCSSFVPPISTVARIRFGITDNSGTFTVQNIRTKGQSHGGFEFVTAESSIRYPDYTFDIETDTSQFLEFKGTNANVTLNCHIVGWHGE